MNHSFKNHPLSDDEKLWLQEICDSEDFDPRVAKVKLRHKLSRQFNPLNIDERLLTDGKHLTIIGLWHADPNSLVFKHIETTIIAIRALIIRKPGIEVVSAKEIAGNTGLDVKHVEMAFMNMRPLGYFYSSASGASEAKGYSEIKLSDDSSYDGYLNFESLDDLMEEYYSRPPRSSSPTLLVSSETPFTSFYPASSELVYSYQSPETAKSELKRNTAFILMAMDPDNPDLEDVYRTIRDVCSLYDINAYRADEIEHQDRITDLILS